MKNVNQKQSIFKDTCVANLKDNIDTTKIGVAVAGAGMYAHYFYAPQLAVALNFLPYVAIGFAGVAMGGLLGGLIVMLAEGDVKKIKAKNCGVKDCEVEVIEKNTIKNSLVMGIIKKEGK